MDIHPPMKKMETLKEYAAHILVVTIGILIALGLEGIRESWHEHTMIREAKSSFSEELKRNQHQLDLDQDSVKKASEQINELITHLDQYTEKPAELTEKIDNLSPGFYFFSTSEWESATASGVLPLMRADQRKLYVDAYLSTHNYQNFSERSFESFQELIVFVASHKKYNDSDKIALSAKLRDLQFKFHIMIHLAGEMQEGINGALQIK